MQGIKFVVTSVITIAIASLLLAASQANAGNYDDDSFEQARISSFEIHEAFITINTISYGCTFYQNFMVAVADDVDNAIEVIQVKPDNCRMKPRNISLTYSIKHLGLDMNQHIKVVNNIESADRLNMASR